MNHVSDYNRRELETVDRILEYTDDENDARTFDVPDLFTIYRSLKSYRKELIERLNK